MATEDQTKTLEYIDGYTDEITDELSEDGGAAVAQVPEQEPEQEIKYDVDIDNNIEFEVETEPAPQPEPQPYEETVTETVTEEVTYGLARVRAMLRRNWIWHCAMIVVMVIIEAMGITVATIAAEKSTDAATSTFLHGFSRLCWASMA